MSSIDRDRLLVTILAIPVNILSSAAKLHAQKTKTPALDRSREASAIKNPQVAGGNTYGFEIGLKPDVSDKEVIGRELEVSDSDESSRQTGSLKLKVVPTPSSLSNQIFP